jgi:ParB-like chromosome segregation protein Spo0J
MLSQRSKEEANAKKAVNEAPEKEEVHLIDVYDLVPSKDNFYNVDAELKQSIEMFGILQPLLVKKPENGKCVIIAGHRRRLAVLALVKEGKENYRYVPCIYKKENIEDKLAIIIANRFRDKTNWERMVEAVEAEELIRDLKKEYDVKGRTRSILEEITGVTNAQMGRYRAIYNNLEDDLMEEFKRDKLTVSVAAEACKLSEEAQHEAFLQIEETGSLTIQDVQRFSLQEAENLAEQEEKNQQEEQPEAAAEEEELQEDHPERQRVIRETGELIRGLSFKEQKKVLEYVKKLLKRR